MPHGYCLHWEPWLLWSYVISDGLTFLSYVSDFAALIFLYIKKPKIAEGWIIPAFAIFIVACGIVHGLLVLSVFRGIYEWVAIAKIIMATVSVPVAFIVWPVVFNVLKLPTPQEHRRVLAEIVVLQRQNQALQSSVDELRGKLFG